MKEVCIDCDVPIEMAKPTQEDPGRRFECPKCQMIYLGTEVAPEEDLRLN